MFICGNIQILWSNFFGRSLGTFFYGVHTPARKSLEKKSCGCMTPDGLTSIEYIRRNHLLGFFIPFRTDQDDGSM